MKTQIKFLSMAAIVVASLFTTTACSKKAKEEKRVEAAIDKQVGTYVGSGVSASGTFLDESITVTKDGKTKVSISGSVLGKTYNFEVKNGGSVSGGAVSGNSDGKAIGYVGDGGLVFGISEDGALALIDPTNSLTLAATKR
jgi:hypothetical protein